MAIPIAVGLVANALAGLLQTLRTKYVYEKLIDPKGDGGRWYRAVGWLNSHVLGTMDELRPWDARIPGLAPAWVRIRKVDGTFVMGYLDSRSHVSTYPDPPSIYLGLQVDVDAEGSYQQFTERTKGFWYQVQEGDILEFEAVRDDPADVLEEGEVQDDQLADES